MKKRALSYLLALLACVGAWAGEIGKFTIVGMGTAPDLITLRAIDSIKKADIVLVENAEEEAYWKSWIQGKEVWYRPISLRIMYGADPQKIADPVRRSKAEKGIKARKLLVEKIVAALREGKNVADLQGGDPMIYGLTCLLEMLPKEIPTEVIPGVGSFQAASAAVKMSPTFGYDTSAVILTMDDWKGRVDKNEKLMRTGSSLVIYTMLLDYDRLFKQLRRYYPAHTPVAVVCDAGDPQQQKVLTSTVGRFMKEINADELPSERHIILVGKFLKVGQARKDFVPQISPGHAPLP